MTSQPKSCKYHGAKLELQHANSRDQLELRQSTSLESKEIEGHFYTFVLETLL